MTGSVFNLVFLVASMTIFIFVLVFFVFEKISYSERKTHERVEKLVGKKIGSDAVLEKIRHSRRKKNVSEDGTYKARKSIITRIGENLQEQLLASDIAMKSEEFVTLWISITFFPAVIAALLLSNTFLAIILVAIGAASPILFMKVKKKKRTKMFETQLADALQIASNSLRSGLSFQQAMETISKDMMAPISSEFGRAVKEMNMGLSMDEALENVQKRVESNEFKIAVIAVSVQRQTGGNLSDILETIAGTLKERFDLKREVASITATGKLSGGVVAALPVIVTIILNLVSPGYLNPMLESNIGKVALIAAVVMEFLGILVIRKITTIKY